MWHLDTKFLTSNYRLVFKPALFEDSQLLTESLEAAGLLLASSFFIVTDETIARLPYTATVVNFFKTLPLPVSVVTVPAGEASKCREMMAFIEDELFSMGCDRNSVIVALGGGVVGDLAGFVAATFHRGVRYLQIPTTLLAMVDSSVGGKTAINTPQGKNLLGAFHQPSLVFLDPKFLDSLPNRHISNGFSEIVKMAFTGNSNFFADLEKGTRDWSDVIRRSVEYKLEIVSRDEKETLGIREVLNFGHTVGHAVESQGIVLHGEAVAIGMIYELRALRSLGFVSEQEISRLQSLLQNFGLPTHLPRNSKIDDLMNFISRDKKKKFSKILGLGIVGNPATLEIPGNLLRRILSDKLTVRPPLSISGFVKLPGSKSISNRALILAAFSAPCVVGNLNSCEDSRVMLDALATLGFDLKFPGPDSVQVGALIPGKWDLKIDLANAGTAARFLVPFVARLLGTGKLPGNSKVLIDGNERMRVRPISDLVDCLREFTVGNVSFDYRGKEGCLPLEISSLNFQENLFKPEVVISGKISSQFVTAVLLTAASEIREISIFVSSTDKLGISTSQPYIEMTFAILRQFCGKIEKTGPGKFLLKPGNLSLRNFQVAADASSASYPMAIAAVSGGSVTVNIGTDDAPMQGDTGFVRILEKMGCLVSQSASQTTVVGPRALRGVGRVDMSEMTDTFLTAAVLMAVADGASEIFGIENQRVKECDRIAAVAKNLEICGFQVEEMGDGLKFPGSGKFAEEISRELDCCGDHRVAMSLAVLSILRPLEIPESRCVEKTFPGFWDMLESDLGCTVEPAPTWKFVPGNLWILVGMRATGKSTAGRLAAEKLGWDFVDLDLEISSRINSTISRFVEEFGWPAFRQKEFETLLEISNQKSPTIITCGGGIVEFRSSFYWLRNFRNVIWLKRSDAETLDFAGVVDSGRPALSGGLAEIWGRRKILFKEISRFVLSVPEGLAGDETASILFRMISVRKNCLPGNFLCLTLPTYATWKFKVEDAVQALEVRVDLLADYKSLGEEISRLRLISNLPLILTVRSASEGGGFSGSDSEYLEICSLALSTRPDFLDVEISRFSPDLERLISEYSAFTKFIASKHSQKNLPRNFQVRADFDSVLSPGWAALGKLVYPGGTGEEISRIHEIRKEAERSHGKSCVAILTGDRGRISRLFNFAMNPVTNSCLPSAAPGQISAEEISRFQDSLGIEAPRDFFLFGSPVKKSPSPLIHNFLFRENDKPFNYTAVETSDLEIVTNNFQSFLFGGCSVTIPLKEKVFKILDNVCPDAARVGAVNTVVRDEISRCLKGYNTDLLALQRGLDSFGLRGGRCLVVGTGGAARAACVAALTRKLQVFVFGRNEGKAEEISREFGVSRMTEDTPGNFDVIIGCVPGNCDLKFPGSWFCPETVVLEMAYLPRETNLVKVAISRQISENRIILGMTLLLWQAVEQARLFGNSKIDEKAVAEILAL